jgi:N6-adenosine-specific RNA methylase IME4
MIELFARERAPSWDCWGLETDRFTNDTFDERDVREQLIEEALAASE